MWSRGDGGGRGGGDSGGAWLRGRRWWWWCMVEGVMGVMAGITAVHGAVGGCCQ